ncbi:MAG: protein containing DUF1628 [Candidatus Syntrophoarchaeum caldarius]|uniref:Protein containing DUF1628 n=1 Tax=Candidatus Syntropharchaeum caldarium TaxID=1838285 RepID=A0A1F2P9N8_9EURY|nr:MAG: protein containing DUF1628 [Candidatus Syntrophoarchaeum caldarius]
MKVIRKDIREDEEAVSPVIGVILMVAITVILAAVIAAFVFGMGPPTAAPQASLRITDTDTGAETVTLVHDGGDSLDLTDVKLIVDVGGTRATWDPLASSTANMSVGDKMVIDIDGDTIKLNGGSDISSTKSGSLSGIAAGDEVTVTFVDKISQKKIAELSARC